MSNSSLIKKSDSKPIKIRKVIESQQYIYIYILLSYGIFFPLMTYFTYFFSLHTKTLRHFNECLKGINLENLFRNVLWKNEK